MNDMPQWVLLLAFWSHMVATIIWLGYLSATTLWIMPALQKSLNAKDYFKWISKSNNRLGIISWLSISVLIVSGLIQMSANENYDGLFNLTNNWALALFIKHIIFFGMMMVSAYISWNIHPKLKRIALLKANNNNSMNEAEVIKRLHRFMALNLILGITTLAMTALARIS